MIKSYASKIMQIYENDRTYEELQLKKRKEEIEKKIPEIMKIEREIGLLGIKLATDMLNCSSNSETLISKQKEKITDLMMKKTELLVSHGYPMDYLEMHYKCDKCKDTGYIGSKRCSCFKNKLLTLYYEDSNLKKMLENNNFSNFNFELFSRTKESNDPKSPRKNMEDILSKAWSFIEDFKVSNENLLFYGSPGTGKTFLSNCIARELIDRGFFVVYRTSEELSADLKKIRFENNSELEDILLNCDLLIIDDLGSEQITDFSKTEFFNFLNKKLLLFSKMLVITNNGLEKLSQLYSERTSSRLLGEFTLCKFYGKDIRVSKNIREKNKAAQQ